MNLQFVHFAHHPIMNVLDKLKDHKTQETMKKRRNIDKRVQSLIKAEEVNKYIVI